MNEHVSRWIPAYYDGELGLPIRSLVELHLKDCPVCQAELAALHRLSALLQEAPALAPERSIERFTADVKLRLPARRMPAAQKALWIGWRMAPLLLIGFWAFSQAALTLSSLVIALGLETYFLPDLAGIGLPWLTLPGLAAGLLFNGLSSALPWLAQARIAIELAFFSLAFTLVIAALLWAWGASWWIYERRIQWITSES